MHCLIYIKEFGIVCFITLEYNIILLICQFAHLNNIRSKNIYFLLWLACHENVYKILNLAWFQFLQIRAKHMVNKHISLFCFVCFCLFVFFSKHKKFWWILQKCHGCLHFNYSFWKRFLVILSWHEKPVYGRGGTYSVMLRNVHMIEKKLADETPDPT